MQQSMVLPSGAFRVRRMCFTVLASLLATPALCAQMVPRRVAVVNFTLGEQAKQVAHQALGIQGDAGVDIANELVTQLGASGKVTLIERGELDRVMKEANMPLDEHFDQADAVKLGKLSGAQSVVLGSVTSLSGGVHSTTMSTLCGFTRVKCPQQTKGEVAITVSVRVVDVQTGAIRATATGNGKASETKTLAAGAKDVEYGNHLLQVATQQALQSVVSQFESSPALAPVPAAAAAPPPTAARAAYTGEILDITGDTIIFEAGSKAGAHAGDVVKIVRSGKVLRDSKGAVVKTMTDTVGTAKITDVDDTTSTATFTAAGAVKPTKTDKAVFKP